MSNQSSSIKDNYNYGKVSDFLSSKITENSKLSIVSAYFTIFAFQHLKKELTSINECRFLFGEPSFVKNLDPSKTNKRDFKIEDDKIVIPIESKLKQKAIAKECVDWIKEKVEIKSIVKPNFLHGKCYQIENENGVKEAIFGSSNFTVSGLGFNNCKNIELNMIIQDRRDLEDLQSWFNSLWNDTSGLIQDVKDEVIKYLEQLYVENEPEFIYYKTLFHLFENYLDEQSKGGLLNEQTGFFESQIWNKLYDFQKDGVKGAINKILKHNGCIIADSVGLGKTFEALAVIKYFNLLNKQVLVLCPKKLADNWTIYQASQNNKLNPFPKDRFDYTVLYHTDLTRTKGKSNANGIDLENFNWGVYDLIVIDESHNFKGNPLEKEGKDGAPRLNRAKWLMDKIIKSGSKTKVLLLSATPVNNNLRDLRNQIYLITEGAPDALYENTGIKDIGSTLKIAQNVFTRWADPKNEQRNVKDLFEKLDSSFFKLLDEVTIARSRKHIISFYDVNTIGKFPERLKPESEYHDIDLNKRFITYDTLNERILQYKLSLFNPSAYLKEEAVGKYEELAGKDVLGFTQSNREHFLIGMMKINFLKRLESSIESFEISLDRTIKKIEKLENKIDLYKKSKKISSNDIEYELDFADESEVEENSEDIEAFEVGKKFKYNLDDIKVDEWLEDLAQDKNALIDLHNNASVVTPNRDAKLQKLKKLIEKKILKPINPYNKKVLIFTAFADTAMYIYEQILDFITRELKLNIALVTGDGTKTTYGKNEFANILTNFSPISKERTKKDNMKNDGEIDILIATDCISEGQNLQDCDCIINYDIHWNPVRVIQRFGRIDRLGSKNEKIKLINFWPTKDLDNYINLKTRVEARMALVDLTATGEDDILNVEEIKELIGDDIKYRDRQLLQLKDEILNLEELDNNISLTDFSLDDFRVELLKFLENNRSKLENAPLGLYSVVPSPSYPQFLDSNKFSISEHEIIKSGVVFCLKQKGIIENANSIVNPLNPFFLVYIREDGNVRYNYSNSKQILEIFRLMCQGYKEPFDELCDLFNQETSNGEDMSSYTTLLNKAVGEIKNLYVKKIISNLQQSRSAIIPRRQNQISNEDSFELITWLIIK